MLNLTPSGVNKSSIVNPQSAIISSPFCSRFRNPDRSTSCVSEIQPVYSDDTNVTCPAGLITINALHVLVDL